MTHYIVQTARAKMPTTCMGGSRYHRVAVLEVDSELDRVSMISARALGCHRVVETWERLYSGTTERCAFQVAIAEASEMAQQLNTQ